MKVKLDFVTNSSSTSFVIAVKDVKKDSKIKFEMEYDLTKNYHAIISNEQELIAYLYDKYAWDIENKQNIMEYFNNDFNEYKKYIDEGFTIIISSFSSEDFDDTASQYLYYNGFPDNVESENFKIIEKDD